MAKHKSAKKNKRPSRGRGPKGKLRHQKKQGGSAPPKGRRSGSHARRIVGTIQKNREGFAFLIPDTKNQSDVYLSPREAGRLMTGDRIEAELERHGQRTSGRVTRILERGKKQVIGKVVRTHRSFGVQSLAGDWFEFPTRPKHELQNGDWIIGRIVDYPDEDQPGMLETTEVLGQSLLPKHDVLLGLAEFGLPDKFPAEVIRETLPLREKSRREVERGRRDDLRDLPLVTIDGEDAKDFDDAIFVEKLKDGGFRLIVAIADVAFFVTPNSLVDQEALRRGTSVYFPGTCIPMLPESLSNDLCSLRPREDKLSLAAEIEFFSTGKKRKFALYECVIRTRHRTTYKQVQEFFDGHGTHGWDEGTQAMLRDARDLFGKLRHGRKERGVLDFDLPECKIQLGADGAPVQIAPSPRWDSNQLIEEFMIAANNVVAEALREEGLPALYRVHEPPDPAALPELNTLLKTFGINKTVTELSPRAFSHILESIQDNPQAPMLNTFILRLQKQARYEPTPKGHFGLALSDYAHFTSPIRRYPDLVVHRAVKELIGRTDRNLLASDEEMTELGLKTSTLERRAMEAERYVTRRKQCWYFMNKIGETFDGIVSGVSEKGLFVAIRDKAADGFIPIESLSGYYQFDMKRQCLRKRPGHSQIGVGHAMRVTIMSVNIDRGEITLAEGTKA